MKPLKLLMVFSVLSFLSLSIISCYTMLSHPTVVGEEELAEDNAAYSAGEPVEVDYSHDCLQCHSAKTHVYINRFYNHYYEDEQPLSSYYWDYAPRAQYYYSSPWWLSDYYYTPAVPMQSGKTEKPLPRPNDFSRRRQPTRSSYSGTSGVSSVGAAVSVPSSSSSNSSSSSAAKQPTASTRRPAKTKSKSSGTTQSSAPKKSKSKKKKK